CILPLMAGGSAAIPISILLAILWVVPAIIIYLVFFVSVPAVLLEDVGPVQAMQRSIVLMREIKARTFLVYVFLVLVAMIFGCGVLLPITLASPNTGQIVSSVIQVILPVFTTLFMAAIVVVTYFDGRVRQDGFRFENLAELFD
ncbi:MAG: hypothetical protein ACYTHM_18410, partial [Planctomycetota bacterium]